MNGIEIFKLAGLMARHAAARQRLIADNIANADTPDFKARDLRPFEEVMAAARKASDGVSDRANFETVETSLPGGASPNGNTVSLSNELLRSAEAASQHETALLVYRKAADILRASLRAR